MVDLVRREAAEPAVWEGERYRKPPSEERCFERNRSAVAGDTATQEQFRKFEQQARYLWEALFRLPMPDVLFDFSRAQRRCKAFYAPKRWEKGQLVLPEISLNPKVLLPMTAIQ